MLRRTSQSRPWLPIALAAALWSVVFPAFGQEGTEPEPATSVPMFQVEIIVFQNLGDAARSEDPDRPPVPPQVLPQDLALVLTGPDDESPGNEPQTEQEEAEPGLLDPAGDPDPPAEEPVAAPLFFAPIDEFSLGEMVSRLRRSSAYRPILHEGWTQPGFDQSMSLPVSLTKLAQLRRADAFAEDTEPPIDSGADETDPLAGDITLYLSRYLHLGLDLSLVREDGVLTHLQGSRRMRSREIHYFDAPGLGVIALVTPVQLDADAAVPLNQSP